MQTGQEGDSGFFGSVAGQVTMLVAALAVVFVIGWMYVW
jgi:hypothetical protein